jgi:homogentisate 1,2-dioxygenase
MPHYRCVGSVPRKRHTVHRAPTGERYIEELVGLEGFSRESSLLYHRNSPSALVGVEPLDHEPPDATANLPVQPFHVRTGDVASPPDADAVMGRRALFVNGDVSLCFARATRTSGLHRNASGDELVYVHKGSPTLESVFGRLATRPGDYVYVPAGTTHRWVVAAGEEAELLAIEARGHIRVPRRYLSPGGQFLEGAPYSERDIRAPDGPLLVDDEPCEVVVRTAHGRTLHRYAHHPFDVVGWDGCLYPWALSIHDFEPIVGRLHQPPPVHQTFEAPGFVVCSFVPRPYDFDADAVKVPYHHANVDSDEVLFYAGGDFMSRAGTGIGVGSLSLHPAGFVHGPQPGSWERSVDQAATAELAVMVDTFAPLLVTGAARGAADPDYPGTWAREGR